jgi:flagellar biosynthetic protein FliO
MVGAIARTVFALAVVLGLLYAVLWGLKRFTSNSAVAPSSESVRIIGRLYLNPKTAIYFVRVADELLLLGTSSSNVSLLTSVKDRGQIEQIEVALKSAPLYTSGKFFSRFFDRSLLKFQKELGEEDTAFDDQIRALDGQLDRLKGIVRRRRGHEKE